MHGIVIWNHGHSIALLMWTFNINTYSIPSLKEKFKWLHFVIHQFTLYDVYNYHASIILIACWWISWSYHYHATDSSRITIAAIGIQLLEAWPLIIVTAITYPKYKTFNDIENFCSKMASIDRLRQNVKSVTFALNSSMDSFYWKLVFDGPTILWVSYHSMQVLSKSQIHVYPLASKSGTPADVHWVPHWPTRRTDTQWIWNFQTILSLRTSKSPCATSTKRED
jgi:hypothetical protein